jgi:hypothetical protein
VNPDCEPHPPQSRCAPCAQTAEEVSLLTVHELVIHLAQTLRHSRDDEQSLSK